MTMFTATPQTSPQPRVDLLLEADPGHFFTEIKFSRDGRRLRSRPPAGGASYEIQDYEAPFGRIANYRADVTVAGGWESTHTEGWPSLDDWQTIEGSPAVSAGTLVGDGVDPATVANFEIPQPEIGRLVIDGYTDDPLDSRVIIGPVIVQLGATSVQVRHLLSGPARVDYDGGPIEVTWSLTSATVVTSEGRVVVNRGPGVWSPVAIALVQPGGLVPGFETFDVDPNLITKDVLYASTVLAEDRVWLIHPTLPALSLPIDNTPERFIELATRQEVSSSSRVARFDPAGRDVAVVYPLGPRQLPHWDLSVFCRTLEARDELGEILRDSQPLLLRVPEGYGNGLFDVPDGWYQVLDASERVVGQRANAGYRLMGLEMLPVAEPPIIITNTAAWGDLIARGLTWGDLVELTWFDVLSGVGDD